MSFIICAFHQILLEGHISVKMGGKCKQYERCEAFRWNNLKVTELLGELSVNDRKY
jgi:hypothetical protein